MQCTGGFCSVLYCIVYSVDYNLYTVQYIQYIALYNIYSVLQCTEYTVYSSVQCTAVYKIYSVLRCKVYTDIRYFPKGFFLSANFRRVFSQVATFQMFIFFKQQPPKSVLAAALDPPGRSQPQHLAPLQPTARQKAQPGSRPLENAFEKVTNIVTNKDVQCTAVCGMYSVLQCKVYTVYCSVQSIQCTAVYSIYSVLQYTAVYSILPYYRLHSTQQTQKDEDNLFYRELGFPWYKGSDQPPLVYSHNSHISGSLHASTYLVPKYKYRLCTVYSHSTHISGSLHASTYLASKYIYYIVYVHCTAYTVQSKG